MQFVDVDKKSKVFTVTSSVPEEGKATTATNLAITLAQAGQKVLLLEADLRRPKVAEILRLESAVGLTTILVGRVDLWDAIQDHSVTNLSVLTSGALPPNPSELLQSQAMGEVLTRLRAEYDVIIVDARALGVVLNMVPQRKSGDSYGYGYGYGYAPKTGRAAPQSEATPGETTSLEEMGFTKP